MEILSNYNTLRNKYFIYLYDKLYCKNIYKRTNKTPPLIKNIFIFRQVLLINNKIIILLHEVNSINLYCKPIVN